MLGFDISPMSARIVHEDIDHLNLNAYDKAIRALIAHPDNEIGVLNRTTSPPMETKRKFKHPRPLCRTVQGDSHASPGC
jgi:hypothetical protein